jgi:integrase
MMKMETRGTVGKSNDPKRKKSRWYFAYRDEKKIQRRKWHRTEREAKATQHRISDELGKGIHTPTSGSITVAAACELWLDDCTTVKRLGPATVRGYKDHVDRYIVPMLGHYKLPELKMADVKEVINKIARDKSQKTARRILYAVRCVLKTAQENNKVAQNVAMQVTVNIKREDLEPLKVGLDFPALLPEEAADLIDAAPPGFLPMLFTALFTGLRWGELRPLTWEDVDLTNRVITGNKSADCFGNVNPKTKTRAGTRLVPIGEELTNILRKYKLVCPRMGGLANLRTCEAKALQIEQLIRAGHTQREICKELHVQHSAVVAVRQLMRHGTLKRETPRSKKDDPGNNVRGRYMTQAKRASAATELGSMTPTGRLHFVFPLRNGEMRSHHIITWEMRQLQRKLGMLGARGSEREGKPKHVPHRTRHYFASWGIQQGWAAKLLQAYLGHATITETLDRYGHLFPDPEGDRERFAKSDAAWRAVRERRGDKKGSFDTTVLVPH